MYAHSISMVPKSKADLTSQLYFHCFLSPNRESLQKYVCQLEPPAKRKEIRAGKSKALADAVVEEADFLCGPVPMRRKELT